MKTIKNWHTGNILGRRHEVISGFVARAIREGGGFGGESALRILDVGCGDGIISRRVATLVGEGTEIVGVETGVRGGEPLEVVPFDGNRLPFGDGSFDIVIMCDVLHHLKNFTAQAELFGECVRVARRGICLKDHTEKWIQDRFILGAMDFVGNVGRGVPLHYNYLDPQQWGRLYAQGGLSSRRRFEAPLGLHPQWCSWLTEKTPWGSSLHFVEYLEKTPGGGRGPV